MSRQASPFSSGIDKIRHIWPWLPYVAPFLVFAVLTFLLPLTPMSDAAAYLLKSVAACIALALFWPFFHREIQWRFDGLAVASGIGVFVIWVGLEGWYPQIGHSSFDPYQAGKAVDAAAAIGIRLFGASLIVPLIEEIFWRSFVMRLLIASRFTDIPLGRFSWYSFFFTAVAFGFEHHRWLPGILAGMVYAALLYRTRNLFSPIQSHAVTNLLLGLYVLHTGQWHYW